ncbi:MAG: GH3 auxin-responsive promoter family protein [Geobacteraceae bacterium]|nr:GH3 auxin-responsive promoter family protein [Geobacteraceae bacterium]
MNVLLAAAARARAARFKARDPFRSQREIFRTLIARARHTRFGRDHGFGELCGLPFDTALQRYRMNVPIRTYADFWREYFAVHSCTDHGRMRLTLDNVTWPGRIPWFCETSGTTAPTKFIPFTSEMFAENRRAALDLTACYLAGNPSSKLMGGKLLYMAGSTHLKEVGNGAWSGDMSAITLRNRPWYLRPFVAPDTAVSALPWEEKVDHMARLLLESGTIRGISGVPPWILLLLKRCSELGGKEAGRLLPHLELIIHGGTGMKPYRSEFEHLFGERPPVFLELLPSSEAFMAFQIPGDDLMRFAPFYGVFFEFVPFESLDERGVPAPDAETVPLWEVETGRRYAVILSTCAGLWRYHIGDTLRFVSRDPLFMEFTGRDRFLDRFEEKVTQGEVEEAVAELNRHEGGAVREFMVGADIPGRRHLWVLAVQPGSERNEERFGRILDGNLTARNADYAAFREQGRIHLPRVIIVDEQEIYRWSKERRGRLGGQSKIPHIDPTPDGEMVLDLARYSQGILSPK